MRVHRAQDTRQGRDEAPKALPEMFARDTEFIIRFEREPKVLAPSIILILPPSSNWKNPIGHTLSSWNWLEGL